ncbi:ATP-binding cassette domain-containing protein [Candidatus Parcubacteria bacterium]|nr:ATP-binding cassette domain-containing protein [Candidatus Parcubacteria bacterium]
MIKIKNLTKKFDGKTVLDKISFDVKQGEILGFLGPNGAGKTTTMKIITGYIPLNKGSVKVDNIDVEIDSIKTRAKIGYLAENNPLYDEMKVFEFLSFIAELRGVDKNEIDEKISEISKVCGLEKVINKLISELSKGFRQRVGLAQAMISDPEILILDEPTSGLDPNQIIEIRELIKKIGKEKTVIFSTHILSEAQAVSDRIIIINNGRIAASGTPDELIKQAKTRDVIYIKIKGDKNEVLRKLKNLENIDEARIKDKESDGVYGYKIKPKQGVDLREYLSITIMKNNWAILEMRQERKSLEGVFRELTK